MVHHRKGAQVKIPSYDDLEHETINLIDKKKNDLTKLDKQWSYGKNEYKETFSKVNSRAIGANNLDSGYIR